MLPSPMSDRLYTKVCDSCGGICPLQAVTCRYCKTDFSPAKWLSTSPLLRNGPVRILLIVGAILVVALVLYTNIFKN